MHKTKNTWRIDGDTLVLLNRRDGVEIYCPAALAHLVLSYTWHIGFVNGNRQTNGKVGFVQTTILDPRGGRNASGKTKQKSLALHMLILENTPEKVRRPDQTEIDHKDGNPLNNRPDNLRWVTRSVNQQNQRDANGMPRRGVGAGRRLSRPWRARIGVEGKIVENKCFFTAREAEEQYLIWKREYHSDTPEVWFEKYATCQATGYWD